MPGPILLFLSQLLLVPPEGAEPRFGASLAAGGQVLVVAGDGESREAGQLFVYELRQGVPRRATRHDVGYARKGSRLPISVATDGELVAAGLTVEIEFLLIESRDEIDPKLARYSVVVHGPGLEVDGSRLLEARPTSHFGVSVDVLGDLVVVGAPSEQLDGHWGGAYLFRRRGGYWEREARLAPQEYSRSYLGELGRAVALGRDRVVIGAPGIPFTISGGPVHVFERRGGEWVLDGMLEPPERSEIVETPEALRRGLDFGTAVDVEGDVVAVGSPLSVAPDRSGQVWLFERDAWEWKAVQVVHAGTEVSWFGSSVRIRGDLLVVSAKGGLHTPEHPPFAGSVYGYRRLDDRWIPAGEPIVGDPATQAEFGAAIAVAGDLLFVGAPGADGGRGAVFRYSIAERFPPPGAPEEER